MRTHKASQKQSSASNPLVSRPFVVQPKPEDSMKSPETQGCESQIPHFTIFNPEGEQSPVQPKLAISAPGDQYEQEADQRAKQAVKMISSPASAYPTQGQQKQIFTPLKNQIKAFPTDQNIVVAQRVKKTPPSGGTEIDVEELDDDYLPNCVDNGNLNRKGYRRSGGITNGWNDTDLFYADGDGPLVQITIKMVNDYWDSRYEGFEKLSGPDWTKNCEDYAKEYSGFGGKIGDYKDSEELAGLIQDNGKYVLQLSFHWMSVQKTGEDSITIRQKDGESAVYEKTFNLKDGLAYILGKRSAGGTVYATS
ncbi:hypothetical protein [Anabaena sp. UHCC 0399]|uniref:hypothetical protein n=1 Tax=Anabaena sp. UHCC 0399 TaxID=3110238 RepID=UPI001687A5BC|nr:hypothetical protein [Anabaena sp. UHCC 0399]MBD2363400.1 hypothetical protein [Anabaena minutissima FACHB-250]MEA5568171.1 hypothetical protein [Anabaena sp. UHCC 0399]